MIDAKTRDRIIATYNDAMKKPWTRDKNTTHAALCLMHAPDLAREHAAMEGLLRRVVALREVHDGHPVDITTPSAAVEVWWALDPLIGKIEEVLK